MGAFSERDQWPREISWKDLGLIRQNGCQLPRLGLAGKGARAGSAWTLGASATAKADLESVKRCGRVGECGAGGWRSEEAKCKGAGWRRVYLLFRYPVLCLLVWLISFALGLRILSSKCNNRRERARTKSTIGRDYVKIRGKGLCDSDIIHRCIMS